MARLNLPFDDHGFLPVAGDAAPRPTVSVKSAGRVLQVLELFDKLQREIRAAEIAERLEIPQSSTSVLLNCLTQLGYLDYDSSSRTFLPSPRVTLLGTWLDSGPIRDGSLVRMLEDLSRQTGDTIILAVLNNLFSRYIHIIQARKSLRFHFPVGSTRLVVWSGVGFALISGMSNERIRLLVRRSNAEARRGQPPIDIRKTLANVEQVRKQGFFFSKNFLTPGSGSISIPLPNGIDRWGRPLAVSIAGPLDDIAPRARSIAAILKSAIQKYF